MSKIDRDKVRKMFGGRCAYCGKPLEAVFHVDHVRPLYRSWDGARPEHSGEDVPENLFPACPRCNNRKNVLSIEKFRKEIESQIERIRRDSAGFRLAEDFGLVAVTGAPVEFYFEKYARDTVQITRT